MLLAALVSMLAGAGSAAAEPALSWSGTRGPFAWEAQSLACGVAGVAQSSRLKAHTRWRTSPADGYQRLTFMRQVRLGSAMGHRPAGPAVDPQHAARGRPQHAPLEPVVRAPGRRGRRREPPRRAVRMAPRSPRGGPAPAPHGGQAACVQDPRALEALPNEKGPPRGDPFEKNRRRPTLPGGCPPSTIGAGGLNFSVRNGKRCFPAAMTTGNCEVRAPGEPRAPSKLHSDFIRCSNQDLG